MEQAVHLSQLTPLSFLERTAYAFPERVCVVDGDRPLTWAELRAAEAFRGGWFHSATSP